MKAIRFRDRRRGSFVISGWMIRQEVAKHELTTADNWPSELAIEKRLKQLTPYGGHVFVRGKLKKRYLVFQVVNAAQRELKSTGMEIRYNRRTKRWVVFERLLSPTLFGESIVDGFGPRNAGYETLRQARASVSVSLLERLAAEA